jgi:hypothetical protein
MDLTNIYSTQNNRFEKKTRGFIGKLVLVLFGAIFCCASVTTAQAQIKETYQYQTTEQFPFDASGKSVQPLLINLPRPAAGKLLVVENVNATIELTPGTNCLCTLTTNGPRVPTSDQTVSLTLPSTLVYHEPGQGGQDVRLISGLERLYVEGGNFPGGFTLKCERNYTGAQAQIRVSVIGYVVDAAQRQ